MGNFCGCVWAALTSQSAPPWPKNDVRRRHGFGVKPPTSAPWGRLHACEATRILPMEEPRLP